MHFRDLNITTPILRALEEAGYTEPTPIQTAAIPPALKGRDLLGCAQTGTGKTAAFAVPILQRLSGNAPGIRRRGTPRALVLTPTRELAAQIGESFADYGKYLDISHAVIFGGVSQKPQEKALAEGAEVLVATPGRLWDLHGQGIVDLSGVEIFVLDEADRMLDMGFIHDVRRIIELLPEQRQTMLFSATMPDENKRLIRRILHDPVTAEVAPVSSTAERIEQSVLLVDRENKRKLLVWLMKERGVDTALIFTRTKHGADRVARELVKNKIPAQSIHGDKSQGARERALDSFKKREIRALVATDIAARGIDIDELPFVINFDLPNIPETYVHRIGRTGRAGQDGRAIAFCDFDEQEYLADIIKLTGKDIPIDRDHPYPMQATAPSAPKPQQRRGQRPAQTGARGEQYRADAAQQRKRGGQAERGQAPAEKRAAQQRQRNTRPGTGNGGARSGRRRSGRKSR